MTNTYSTGNPLGSTSPKDLYDNASNFDEAMNSDSPAFIDRFGKRRETFAGFEALFAQFLVESAFVWVGDYAAGLIFTSRNQYTVKDGVLYRLDPSVTLPYTTTGVWASEMSNFVAFSSSDTAMIARSIQKVETVAQLRALLKTNPSQYAQLPTGYTYKVDQTDTTSADNNGTIIVATDGGRWKVQGVTAITPQLFQAVADGVANDTVAFQAAWDFAQTARIPFLLNAKYKINTWRIVDGHVHTVISNCAEIIGAATVSTPALLEMFNTSDVKFVGEMKLTVNYNLLYGSAVLVHAELVAQYNEFNGITVSGARVAWRFGNVLYPDTLISETTITGGHTYGCPHVIDVIGVEIYVSVSQATWVSDYGGGTGAWLSLPRRGIQVAGGNVRMTGGQLLMTDITTGRLCNIRALGSIAYQSCFGGVRLVNVTVENASSLCTIANELGVSSIASGLGGFTAIGCDGFVGSDADVMVYATADFPGKVVIKDCDFFYIGTRSSNNMQFDGTLANVYCDPNSFGRGFKNYIAGVVGGVVHFNNEQVLQITGLTGVVFPASTQVLLPYQSIALQGPAPRWQTYYDNTTGIFTVPPGGLSNVEIVANLVVSGVTAGEMRLFINSTQWIATPFVGNCGQLVAKIAEIAAGTTIQVGMFASSGTGTASSATPLQRFTISASR